MSKKNDELGDKIKLLEDATETILPQGKPIIVRLDGNSFSKFTLLNNFQKPFDSVFQEAMINAVKALMGYCSEIKFGYTQSDEITLVLYNPNLEASPFLSNRVQKICSLFASVCSNGFNSYILEKTGKFLGANFDCRIFPYELSEVDEPFVWRQRDCFKNCVSSMLYWGLINEHKMTARAATKLMEPHSMMRRVELIQEKLGIDIYSFDSSYTRGVGVYKIEVEKSLKDLPEEIRKFNVGKEFVIRSEFKVDKALPYFSSDTEFIKRLLK